MSAKQAYEFDLLVERHHFGGAAKRHPGYDQCEDGSDTYCEIIVYDHDLEFATSEFRCLGFVVASKWIGGAA
jgi:hypothetical protein